MGLTMKPSELIKFLKINGYEFVRSKRGSHQIYSNGIHTIPIPFHGNKEFDEDFIQIILKETGIPKSELLKYLKR